MVADGSHCDARTGLDLCEVSEQPVIYSHSCMRSVWDHPRNITDEQTKECAATGGVIDHAVDLVGPEHGRASRTGIPPRRRRRDSGRQLPPRRRAGVAVARPAAPFAGGR
ncbi:hypothetical protein GCM10009837_76510 [Streptomyces durmitorensis]